MIRFLLRRFVTMAVTLLIISALIFFIIKLPPGDFLSNQIAELRERVLNEYAPASICSMNGATSAKGASWTRGPLLRP